MIDVDDILLPLAIAVLIDKKVRNPELQAFVTQAQALIELFELPALSENVLRAWFETHRDGLREKLDSKRRNTLILRALTRFSDDVHIENMFDAMVQISISDDEYRKEESDLIKSAAALWGYNRPPIKVATG